jgi:hypothetical protein
LKILLNFIGDLERWIMRSDKVKAVFRECLKFILGIIGERGKIRIYYDFTPKVDLLNRTWHLELEQKNIYPHLFEFKDELLNSSIVKECLALMLEENFPKRLEMEIVDKNGKPVQNPNYEPFLMDEILGTITAKYLEKYGCDFNEEKFEEIYREMVSYVYSPERELVLVSPLENFDLKDLDEFSIDEYRIRKLSEEEIKTLIGFGYRLGFIFTPEHGTIENIYCVERIIKTPKRSRPPLPPYIEDFVTTLRLFKSGVVGFNLILSYPKIWKISWSGQLTLHMYSFKQPPKYIFEQKDLESFISFWNQFKKVKNQFPSNIKFSLRWFNKSYREQEVLDRLLDLAIALEVLFKVGDRLDLYVPHFIGSNKEEKRKINEDIRKLQKVRGAIVHSGYYECEREFVDSIENYYRVSMQKLLELLSNQSYESIIESLKDSMLD